MSGTADGHGSGGVEALVFSTLRLEAEWEDGRSLSATAFVFEFRADGNRYPFLITARHAVAEAVEGRITFIPETRGRPDLSKGYTLDIENFAKLWYLHPDEALDVAVTPFVPFVRHIEDSGVPLYYHTLREADDAILARPLTPLVLSAHAAGLAADGFLLPQLLEGRLAEPRLGSYVGRDRYTVDVPLFPGAAGAPLLVRRLDGGASLAGMLTHGYVAAEAASPWRPVAEACQAGRPALGCAVRPRAILSLIRGYLMEKGFL